MIDYLLAVPTGAWGDVTIKLAITAAAGEAGSLDAAFPWSQLRHLLANVARSVVLEG